MAATLLNSPRATEISVHVVRAFVQWRSMLATNRELSQKLHKRPIGFVHPQEAGKSRPNALNASAAKKAAIAAPTKAARKK